METNYPPTDPLLMHFLLAAYSGHGCATSPQGNWINIENGRLLARATCNENQHSGLFILQADFLTVIPSGEHILESFAGWGEDRKAALKDACRAFLDSTFHAILSALLGCPSDHAETMLWEIDGVPRKLTFGAVRMRGNFPSGQWPAVFNAFEEAMMQSNLPAGRHWVRCFYSSVPGQVPVVEVLLDNEPWQEMQQKAKTFPWPVSDEFYSARIFAIIEDA